MISNLHALVHSETITRSIVSTYKVLDDPGSDNWLIFEFKRKMLMAQVKRSWAYYSNRDSDEYPLTESATLSMWVQWRKYSAGSKHLTLMTLNLTDSNGRWFTPEELKNKGIV